MLRALVSVVHIGSKSILDTLLNVRFRGVKVGRSDCEFLLSFLLSLPCQHSTFVQSLVVNFQLQIRQKWQE